MISVIIPTNNTRFIYEAVNSVLNQTYQDFEIIIIPNGDATLDCHKLHDHRIRIIPYSGKDGIGAIKLFGFMAARGDLLVELDHDDILVPNALEELAKAMAANPEAGFFYSNFAEFRDGDWTPHTYNPYWGWKYRHVNVLGHNLIETISFKPSPASLGHIWYAPNHIRAWTHKAYHAIGGHNKTMIVGDDHDLLVRTYLTTEMIHIDKCLYLYRIHDKNTAAIANKSIQRITYNIYNKYIDALVLRWAKLNGLQCYDLGGAHNACPGWTTVDYNGGDVIVDLTKPWPWQDSSVAAFRLYDMFEHLPKLHTIKEIYRCLVPGGWVLSMTPSADGNGYAMDPTHISPYVKQSFWYYTKPQFAKYIGTPVKFQEQRLERIFPSAWHEQENIPYIVWDAISLKDGYDGPGPHEWQYNDNDLNIRHLHQTSYIQ